MSEVVLDASAVLASLQSEPGAEYVQGVLSTRSCAISSVNVAEVASKLAERGAARDAIEETIASLQLDIQDFNLQAALDAAMLRPITRAQGLSLADRACLALAQSLGLPAITTDRSWAKLTVDIPITLARHADA